MVAEVFTRINAERAARGLGALTWDAQLYCAARDWSATMASTATFAHQDLVTLRGAPTYGTYDTLGENIARGPGTMTGGDVVNAWMNSPSHGANLHATSYRDVGIGTTVAGDGTRYVSAVFGG